MERFARGEIDEDEFNRRSRGAEITLSRTSSAGRRHRLESVRLN